LKVGIPSHISTFGFLPAISLASLNNGPMSPSCYSRAYFLSISKASISTCMRLSVLPLE
jgi:hypothetical protein